MKIKNPDINEILEWNKKYVYLQRIIKELSGKKESGHVISSFILHAQLIEYRLKKEINLIASSINSHTHNSPFKLITKSPVALEEEKLTLGNLIRELDRYDGEMLKKLKTVLKELLILLIYRNRVNHGLFNIGTLVKVEKDAIKGNELASKAWNEMESINYFTSGEYYSDMVGSSEE